MGLLEVMKHCGWNSMANTARGVEKELPSLPHHLQLKFHGYRYLGDFGDGYINILPPSLKRDEVPLLTNCAPPESLFASVSILLYGHVNKMQLLRLATICHEIRNCSLDKKNLIYQEIRSTTSDTSELREMHLEAISSVTNRTITVHSEGGIAKYYSCENTRSVALSGLRLSLVFVPLKGDTGRSFLPVVDGCLVGRGQRFFNKCGAQDFGVCQGDFGEKIGCSKCGRNYHKHCVEMEGKPLHCGCHILMPYHLKDETFYKDDSRVHQMLKQINLQELIKAIESKKQPSFRMEIFRGKSCRRKQVQMEKQKSLMVLSEEMIHYLQKTIQRLIHCSVNDALDIYIPEILVKIIKKQEDINRLVAELMFLEM